MAGSLLSGLTMNPNYHEFGPSAMENELAKIAAGQDRGLAFSMGIHANNVRQQDNENYYNRLDQGDAIRQGYAMQLGQQTNQNERLKMLTAVAAKEGVPLGAILRVAQTLTGETPTATPELEASDNASLALKRGQALQAAGAGVNSSMEGGTKIPARSMDDFMRSINVGGGYDVQPTSVQAANAKALADLRPKLTINGQNYITGEKDAGQLTGSPEWVVKTLKENPDIGRLFAGSATTVGGTVTPPGTRTPPPAGNQIMPQSGLALGGNFTMNKPPPAAPGLSVGPQMSTDPSNTPGELPVGSDASVQPQQRDEYNRVLAGEQAQGYALGSPRGMADGSLLIPRQHTKSGARDNVRIFRDPAQANGYNMRYEPL